MVHYSRFFIQITTFGYAFFHVSLTTIWILRMRATCTYFVFNIFLISVISVDWLLSSVSYSLQREFKVSANNDHFCLHFFQYLDLLFWLGLKTQLKLVFLKKIKTHTMFWMESLTIITILILPKWIYKLNAIIIRIP